MVEVNKAKFDEDGYTLIKNVLTKEEVEELRRASYKLIE